MFYKKKKEKKLPLFDKAGVKVKRKPDYTKKLDAVFSQYIRLYHSDHNGMCRCISCGKYHHWTKIQCGHYMSRRHLATRWHTDNCRPQCVACNIFNQGAAQMFRRGLVREIGEQRVDIVESLSHTSTHKFTDFEFRELIKHYQSAVDHLKEEKGIT